VSDATGTRLQDGDFPVHAGHFHRNAPKTGDNQTLNGRIADRVGKAVGSMWLFYASCVFFVIWIAGGVGTTLGDPSPYGLMLLYVGGVGQWLTMIAILNQGNRQSDAADARSKHMAAGIDTVLDRLDVHTQGGIADLKAKLDSLTPPQ